MTEQDCLKCSINKIDVDPAIAIMDEVEGYCTPCLNTWKQENNQWPYSNKIGYCWCGHSHKVRCDDQACVTDNENCCSCQCINFVEDKWATNA